MNSVFRMVAVAVSVLALSACDGGSDGGGGNAGGGGGIVTPQAGVGASFAAAFDAGANGDPAAVAPGDSGAIDLAGDPVAID